MALERLLVFQVWDLHTYWRSLGNNYTTFPEYFKGQGYETVGMGKIFHPGSSSGTNSAAANSSRAHNSSACPANRCGPCSDDQLFSWSRPFFHSENQEGSPGGGFGDPDGKAWAAVNAADAKHLVSKNDEFRIQNEKICIENEELCI